MPFTYFALFIIFIEHQFKKVLKQHFVLFLFFYYDHALHIQFTYNFKKKNDPTIEKGKIWIPLIKLNVRPTSTPVPKREQLISGLEPDLAKGNN